MDVGDRRVDQAHVGVSQDLREGVRLSIEIIANEVVARRAAQHLEPLPADQAQLLAQQSLRFLYRILFLLYAEASPELGVLPVGEQAYERGYSIDRLRELTLTELPLRVRFPLPTCTSRSPSLFRLVDQGHDAGSDEPALAEGLTFRELRADLFKPEAIALIREVKLGDAALQQVLPAPAVEQAGRGSRPWLHLVRAIGHQPARCGV